MLTLHLTLILTLTPTLILTLTLTLSERNAILWRPVNYNLAIFSPILVLITSYTLFLWCKLHVHVLHFC